MTDLPIPSDFCCLRAWRGVSCGCHWDEPQPDIFDLVDLIETPYFGEWTLEHCLIREAYTGNHWGTGEDEWEDLWEDD
jgi:hypothetical protein